LDHAAVAKLRGAVRPWRHFYGAALWAML